MSNILLFGGTTEGRIVAEYLETMKVPCFVCVATTYGKEVLPEFVYCQVIDGRMDEERMHFFMTEKQIDLVIDATHPYAIEVTKNIKHVTEKNKITYIRVIRAASEPVEHGKYFQSIDELISYINKNPKNTLVTTGSKEIGNFTKVKQFEKYIYARVLPLEENVKLCYEMGLTKDHVIGMKGPFSVAQNIEQIQSCGAEYIVTKDTGNAGGFPEKYQAAEQLGKKLLIIARPTNETGMTTDQLKEYIRNYLEKGKKN